MDIKQLEYFVTIVNSDFNLRKAAQSLHLTQPLLSMVIADIESRYKIKLMVKKSTRYIGLTPEGKVLFEDAKQIIKMFKTLEMKLENYKDVHHGTIKVGIPPIIISTFFKNALPNFIASFPNIKVEIYEYGANILRTMLKEKKLDYAILVGFQDSDVDVKSTPICVDELVAYINSENPLSTKKYLTFSDLHEQKMVLLGEDFVLNTVVRHKFEQALSTPNITFTSGQWDLLMQLVDDGSAITILPAALKPIISTDEIKTVGFTPVVKWTISLATHVDTVKSSSAMLFEKFMLDHFERINFLNKQKQRERM